MRSEGLTQGVPDTKPYSDLENGVLPHIELVIWAGYPSASDNETPRVLPHIELVIWAGNPTASETIGSPPLLPSTDS
jgi:hypothetical protein